MLTPINPNLAIMKTATFLSNIWYTVFPIFNNFLVSFLVFIDIYRIYSGARYLLDLIGIGFCRYIDDSISISISVSGQLLFCLSFQQMNDNVRQITTNTLKKYLFFINIGSTFYYDIAHL